MNRTLKQSAIRLVQDSIYLIKEGRRKHNLELTGAGLTWLSVGLTTLIKGKEKDMDIAEVVQIFTEMAETAGRLGLAEAQSLLIEDIETLGKDLLREEKRTAHVRPESLKKYALAFARMNERQFQAIVAEEMSNDKSRYGTFVKLLSYIASGGVFDAKDAGKNWNIFRRRMRILDDAARRLRIVIGTLLKHFLERRGRST